MSPLRSRPASRRTSRGQRAALLSFLAVAGLTVLGIAAGGSAEGADVPVLPGVRTEPAANAVLASPPGQLSLRLPDTASTGAGAGGAAASTGEATVYTADHSVVAQGPLTASGAGALQLALPKLPKGVYTVVWSLGGGAAAGAGQGTFAFAVNPGGASAIRQVPATSTLAPPLKIAVGWLPWIAVSLLTGVAALRLLVTAPVARRMGDPAAAAAALAGTDRRLIRIAAIGAAVLLPASVVQLAYQPATDSFAFGDIGPALTADFGGYLDLARLVVTAVALVLLVPAALRPARPGGAAGPVLAGGFALGLLELLARVLPAKPPADVARTVISTIFTFGHLAGAAVWIGGLAGLTALATVAVIPEGDGRRFWPAAIRRFATVAMSCVLALTVSGLWLTWSHVGSLGQFVSTLYGRTLAVKLILFGGLLALGAFHEFWLLPRVEVYRAVGDGPRLIAAVSRRFRGAVAAEVALGLAVLLVVPMLSGSARAQDAAANALTQTATAGSTTVTLTPSGAVPGLTDYLVTVPDGATHQVSMSFAAPALGIPATQVPATALGGGRFQVSGLYTPVAGRWDVRVALDSGPQQAAFTLPVTKKVAKPPKPAPPALTGTIWAWGIAAAVALAAILIAAGWLSRQVTLRLLRRSGVAERLVPVPQLSADADSRAPAGRVR
jgi:putative copper export protein